MVIEAIILDQIREVHFIVMLNGVLLRARTIFSNVPSGQIIARVKTA
jgi:hypothetical protein